MKRTMILLALAGLTVFSSCKKDEDDPKPITHSCTEVNIDASAHESEWHYFSFVENKEIGVAAEADSANAIWFARTDWDIAINRFKIRTNSGLSSTTNAQGGVYIFDKATTFESITAMPSNPEFLADTLLEYPGHGAPEFLFSSKAQVIYFKLDENGIMVMPPVYLPSPVYAFRSADGEKAYKVHFTQYKDEEGTSGKIKFSFSELN